MRRLLPIVEGHGDLEAVPNLIRRVLHEVHQCFDIELLPAQRRGEWPKVKREFDRYYLAARLESAPILWVLDFDCDDCIDPDLEREWALSRAKQVDSTGRLEMMFIVKEYESLFLWDKRPLEQAFGQLASPAVLPSDPESVRDAKGYVSTLLPKGRAYKPSTDQARVTSRLDLALLAQQSASYSRFEQAVLALCQQDA